MRGYAATQTAVAVTHPSVGEPCVFTLQLPIAKTVELFARSQGVPVAECRWVWTTAPAFPEGVER